ncbi:Glycosyltransferase involved in cell wall bisynthesis [Caldanaerobius fijiensis DSM 17918]|uniref:Glycosyltransferase involved in cell wall bisynthesis n=1 Tax=Caldanaerobius fijiensis DSM 17918 TaxID=1121256 RepID=A0A1M4VHY1_9THEO|nr:glycosyltransferase family 4 protein [Caldanaerobius fijiensis]SHE68500.1 Glycosyltransferase involved in cell wall bisynthesis [Caldanaerobius fijiensis DSM 17918]
MNILVVTSFDYPHVGGLSTHVEMLTGELKRLGHKVDVVSFSDVNRLYAKYVVRGVSFILNKLKRGLGIVYTNKQRIKLLKSLVNIRLNKTKYDLINAEDPAAMIALKGIDLPKVLTVHGYATFEYLSIGSVLKDTKQEAFLYDMERQAYNMADALIAVDTRIKNYLKDFAKKDATVIRNFVDTDIYDIKKYDVSQLKKKLNVPENKKILLCPRRLTEKNGVVYPAMAVNLLKEKYPNIMLYYAGDGEEREKIENYIAKYNLHDYIKLLGSIPHDRIVEYFCVADVVLIPSVHSKGIEEATSIAAIEAMAMGKPTIASAIGGLKELIENGKSGILVQEKNEIQLADAILKVLTDDALREALSTGARQRVIEEFSLSSGVQKYLDVYQKVIVNNQKR